MRHARWLEVQPIVLGVCLCVTSAAGAQERTLRVSHVERWDDTAGETEGGERRWAITLRADGSGVTATARAGHESVQSECEARGRADVHPARGEEEPFVCTEAFGALALRDPRGGLGWAGVPTPLDPNAGDSWSTVRVGDLTGDGRAEIALAGSFVFDLAMRWEPWRSHVLTFERYDAATRRLAPPASAAAPGRHTLDIVGAWTVATIEDPAGSAGFDVSLQFRRDGSFLFTGSLDDPSLPEPLPIRTRGTYTTRSDALSITGWATVFARCRALERDPGRSATAVREPCAFFVESPSTILVGYQETGPARRVLERWTRAGANRGAPADR